MLGIQTKETEFYPVKPLSASGLSQASAPAQTEEKTGSKNHGTGGNRDFILIY